jgi:DNA-binding response OmpR family regulator
MASRILSLGKDKHLMSSRTMLLVSDGYKVDEAYSADMAIRLVASDLFEASVICHTVDESERQEFVSTVRHKKQQIPIIFIRSFEFETAPATCIAIDNDPEILLNAVRLAISHPST